MMEHDGSERHCSPTVGKKLKFLMFHADYAYPRWGIENAGGDKQFIIQAKQSSEANRTKEKPYVCRKEKKHECIGSPMEMTIRGWRFEPPNNPTLTIRIFTADRQCTFIVREGPFTERYGRCILDKIRALKTMLCTAFIHGEPNLGEVMRLYARFSFLLLLLLLLCAASLCGGVELTFELPDNQVQCYYEEIGKGVDFVLEFQVITGGQYDVDLAVESPSGQKLFSETRKQFGSFSWKTVESGTYKVCFSNEFSTFSHKMVYMDWQVGDVPALPKVDHQKMMGLMEVVAGNIYDKLKQVDDYQTHHRLNEATGRKFAEELNDGVLVWSVGQTIVMVTIGIGQVMILKSFFSDRHMAHSGY
uniref:GOLD domain-containing protein n=1 Tax=Trichuris muris TaxID=70415 RepID=A0A5S6Q857_TRIMR